MVGGTVIGVSQKEGDALLNVAETDQNWFADNIIGDTCAVRCSAERIDNGRRVRIMPGDKVWWQCGKVYWTPARKNNEQTCRYEDNDDVTHGDDIALKKIGYSH